MLREQIFDEIKARTRETDLSVPTREGDWWYYTRTVEGKQYGIHCRAPIAAADDWEPPVLDEDAQRNGLPGEQILLDDNVEAEGPRLLLARQLRRQRRRHPAAVGGRHRGRRALHDPHPLAQSTTASTFPDEIAGTAGGALFDQTGAYIFYTTVDDVVAAGHRLAAPRSATARDVDATSDRCSTSPTSGTGSASASPAAGGSW